MIVRAGVDTAAALAALHGACFPVPWNAAEIAALLANPCAFALVAREAAPLGFVLAWTPAGEAEILTLAVAPPARRNGVGVALVEAAMAVASLNGAAAMHLEVSEANAAARALYAKLGFTEAGRRRGYYRTEGGQCDAIVLVRALPASAVSG